MVSWSRRQVTPIAKAPHESSEEDVMHLVLMVLDSRLRVSHAGRKVSPTSILLSLKDV
jgi:hypothetical protein